MSDVSRPSDYERSDADPRLIGAIALGTAVFLLLTPFALKAIYPGAEGAGRVTGSLPVPPKPRLQVKPKIDLDQLRSYERGRLETSGWVDRERQVVRIPVDRAIELLAQRGWPAPPTPSPSR